MLLRSKLLEPIYCQIDFSEFGECDESVRYFLQTVVIQFESLKRVKANDIVLGDFSDLVEAEIHVFEFFAEEEVRHGCEAVISEFYRLQFEQFVELVGDSFGG